MVEHAEGKAFGGGRSSSITRLQLTFLLLIIMQWLHSFEEYLGRLYKVFPLARFVSGLISENLS